MAVRTITTEISIKNEAEFKRQIKAVNNSLAGMKSEMTKVSAEFDGQANSAEALRKKQALLQQQYDQQKEKVQALAAMLESAKSAYDENSDVVLKYQKQLNYATVDLIKFDRELKNTDRYLEEAERSADGTSSSIDEFGKTVKEAGKDAGDSSDGMGAFGEALANLKDSAASGDLNGVVSALGSLKSALVGGAALAGVKALADGIVQITDSSKEYRTILGTLEVSSQKAGYTQEQTTEIYRKFQAVLGDTQKAATATANLQALGLSQENLRVIMEEAIGAWATYGDSIPIDSLSESINETVQVGKVTGVFADALNWAGTSEDEFNEKLAACATTADRANLVLSQLSQQGLQATGQAWVENNQDIVAANEAQEMMNESTAQLGEALQPAAAFITEYGSALVDMATMGVNAIASLIEAFDNLFNSQQKAMAAGFANIESQYSLADYQANGLTYLSGGTYNESTKKWEGVSTKIDYDRAKKMQEAGTFVRASGVSRSDALKRGWSVSSIDDLVKKQRYQQRWGLNGSHAGGLDYVPFDGYVAELHQGEAVLTAGEANFLRDAMASGRALSGGRRSAGVSDSGTGSAGGAAGTPRVYDLTIPVELTIDGATFARKEYKYRIAEDNRRGVSLAGRGGTR